MINLKKETKNNMSKTKKSQLGSVGVLALVWIVWLVVSWGVNFSKFIDADFEAPYKKEVVHGLGIVPFIALVTCWIDIEDGKKDDDPEA